MGFDRATFWAGYRNAFGKVPQEVVDAIEFLLGKFEADPIWKRVQHVSYALATIKHETAGTFKPIREYRNKVGSKGRANQDRYWHTGFYGRGYVQLTWKKNYELFHIENSPDKALEPETAFLILTTGMFSGLFTGKAFKHFIHAQMCDYKSARKIINGLDKADEIAGYARNLEKILKDSAAVSASPPPTEQTQLIDAGIPIPPPAVDNSATPQPPNVTTITESPSKTVISADTKGDAADAKPAQVSTGRNITHALAWFGGPAGIATAVWGFINNNGSAITTGIVCSTIIILAVIYRKAILDGLRMQIASDPDKNNVT